MMFADIYLNLGYKSLKEFILFYFIPSILIAGVFSLVFYVEPTIPNSISLMVFIIAVIFVIAYPVLAFVHRSVEIQEHLHFFITYASALANLQISKAQIFKKVAEYRRFGYISDISEKIVYFVKNWNITFAEAVRKLSKIVPSKIFEDFLARLATVSDFGEDIEEFFDEEQKAVMTDLENEYHRTFENIKMIQEIFVSLMITIAFMMSISLLMPILSGMSFETILKIGLMIVFIVDTIIVFSVWLLIPKDPMFHDLDIKDKDSASVTNVFIATAPFSIFILMFIGLSMVDKIPFLLTIALGISPLIIPALYAIEAENKVYERDKAFPTFIRTLGDTLETKGGAVLSTLEGLRVHDFGPLQDQFVRLYRRLKLGSDKYLSWLYFAGETGSNLIYNFVQIFVEAIYLGANAQKVGRTISENFTRILNLRKIKFQLASQLRGAFYGALVGFTVTTYISANITQRLAYMFATPMKSISGLGEFETFVNSLIPTIPKIDMFVVNTLIGIMILIHAIASSLTIKIVEGGHKIAAFFDFIIMVWLGAFLSTLIPIIMEKLLPTFTLGSAFT